MPNITLKQTRQQAADLYLAVNIMPGEAIYKAAREGVQRGILKVWPELEAVGVETPAAEIRDLDLDPKQQRALAEGFLSLANNPQLTGQDYVKTRQIASMCRLWGWVESHIQQRQVPDFDGKLDGEPALVDP